MERVGGRGRMVIRWRVVKGRREGREGREGWERRVVECSVESSSKYLVAFAFYAFEILMYEETYLINLLLLSIYFI